MGLQSPSIDQIGQSFVRSGLKALANLIIEDIVYPYLPSFSYLQSLIVAVHSILTVSSNPACNGDIEPVNSLSLPVSGKPNPIQVHVTKTARTTYVNTEEISAFRYNFFDFKSRSEVD
jgi:hypothetical protein